MAYVNFISGFNIQSAAAIDKRLVLTPSEMENADEDLLPDVYFCICAEGTNKGKLFLFDKNNTPINDDTKGQYGKYKVFESEITYTTTEAKTNLNTAVADTTVVQTMLTGDTETEGSIASVVSETLDENGIDGGDIE